MPEVLADTSPLQYLFQAGLLDLLHGLYTEITVAQAVKDELDAALALYVPLPDIASLPWIKVRKATQQALLLIAPDLGAGERETLALAIESPGLLVLLDDSLARRQARLLNVAFTGTLGLLLKAKESGRLPAIRPVVDLLEALGFRLDPKTRLAVLSLSGE